MVPVGYVSTLLAVARSQVGVRETVANGGKEIRRYQSATWLSPGSWPWCAAFICWCIARAAKDVPLPFPLPDTPRAREFAPWAKRVGLTVIRRPASVVAGDIVMYRFASGDHVGIVSKSFGDTFEAIEGNTDGSGGRDGDGVYVRRRPLSTVHAVVAWDRAKPVKL